MLDHINRERDERNHQRSPHIARKCEALVVAPLQPAIGWEHTTAGLVDRYQAGLKSFADREPCGFADVTGLWQQAESVELLANGVNHPNDLGHWLYAAAVASAF